MQAAVSTAGRAEGVPVAGALQEPLHIRPELCYADKPNQSLCCQRTVIAAGAVPSAQPAVLGGHTSIVSLLLFTDAGVCSAAGKN